MMARDEIEQKVEKILQSADSFSRYEGKPFLLTRVMAAVENKTQAKPAFVTHLILQPYLLTFILLLNIFSAIYFFKNNSSIDQNREQYIDQLAIEFSISSNSYDLTTLIGEE
ncbi:MAG: hypothetical protein K9H64_06805 [Bacteroidales bacterium]|nr:hypothetical protein [Bacteroidales bacterium]MCF8455365.1 hypothetical protein [Bacteroidales bacterium]